MVIIAAGSLSAASEGSCDGFFLFFLKPTDQQVSEPNIGQASYSLVLRTLRGLWEGVQIQPPAAALF